MKRLYLNIAFLVTLLNIFYIPTIDAQTEKLDVEGDVKIRGNLNVANNKDTTSIYAGVNAGINATLLVAPRWNTFFGVHTGMDNFDGFNNSFFGHEAGANNVSGSRNSFFGWRAGYNNTTGNTNCFFGEEAGESNNASSNSFFGWRAGFDNQTGNENCFFGRQAGEKNVMGNSNCYYGFQAGKENTGTGNSYFGYKTASMNTTGYSNTYIGVNAGDDDQVGYFNTFVGASSGDQNVGGNRSTYIGAFATPTMDSLVKAISIGYQAQVDCSNCAVIGGTGSNAVRLGVGTSQPTQSLDINGNARIRSVGSGVFISPLNLTSNGILTTSASDARLKENISTLADAINIVTSLRGVRYNWKTDNLKEPRIGLIAQEVEKILPEVVFTNPVDGYKGVRYQEIVAVLIEAFKEQQVQLVNIKNDTAKRIKTLEDQLAHLYTLIKENDISTSELK